ncbi:MAG: leucine-rich repeat protein, partial [Clostridia bacterium]|nr:leucine-rich repeat protein [Clostridia bacterium]
MNIRKKIIISLSVVFSMMVALVVGLINMPKPNTLDSTSEHNVIKVLEPSKMPIEFEYEADARLQNASNSQTEKVYKLGFGNSMDKSMALKLMSNLQQDNVTVKYGYGSANVSLPTLAKLQAEPGITISDTYDIHNIPKSTKLYVYIIVSVIDPSISTSFATTLSWGYGVPTVVTYKVGTTTYTSNEILNLAMPEPEEPEVSEGMQFGGWYLDEECTIPATFPLPAGSNTQLYAKEEESYPEGNLGSSWFQLNSDGQSYMVIKGQITASQFPSDGNVVIPETYNGLPVTKMKDTTLYMSAVFYNSGVVSVTIPKTMTNIGKRAFQNCITLTSVTIWSNSQLATIGDYAFLGCSSLTSLTIPNSVTSIASDILEGCSGLT